MKQKVGNSSFKRNLRLAVTVFLIALIVLSSFIFNLQQQTAAADAGPLGTGKGIFSGRVTWAHDQNSTSWNGTSGFWWEDKNIDQSVVDTMVSNNILALTGQKSDVLAWGQIFRYFNKTHGGTNVGYKRGEKIAIKVNMNGVSSFDAGNGCFTSPHVIYSVLMQLVTKAGVNPSDITVFDASRAIPDNIFNKCKVAKLKGVHFADFKGGSGRERSVRDTKTVIHWSYDVKGNPTYLPTYVTAAKYMINIASLKGHNLAGITLTAKNHFGTIMNDLDGRPTGSPPQGANLHGFATAHDYGWGDPKWSWPQRKMGTYNPLVDLIGHKDLGGKTVLYMLDALYTSNDQSHDIESKYKWRSAPFNNDWPSSIFVSQDPVALDSVGYDFLKNEPMVTGSENVLTRNSTAENYLHEAALANDAPSKTVYDPEGDKTTLGSLGVHEHWNNAADKKYSKNLGQKKGIELIKVTNTTPVAKIPSKQVRGLWMMEDLAASDKSSYIHKATKIGTPTLTIGKFGKGLEFNANEKDWYTIPDITGSLTSKTFTVSCWVNAKKFLWADVIEKRDQTKGEDNNYCIFTSDKGTVYTAFRSQNETWEALESKGKLTLNNWHHLAGTYDGNILKLYIDGKLDSTKVINKLPKLHSDYLAIGGGANGAYFSGIIDEALILDYPASQSEIINIMNNGIEKTFLK